MKPKGSIYNFRKILHSGIDYYRPAEYERKYFD